MITPMKKFTFLVFHRDYEAFLEDLREAGVVHVSQRAAGLAEDADLQALIARRAEIKHLLQQGWIAILWSHINAVTIGDTITNTCHANGI